MALFWDTSAVLALVVREPHSPEALAAAAQATEGYAWRWLRVEAEAGLARRQVTAAHWQRLEETLAALWWVDIPVERFGDLARANREWRLRAADAGHFFCFRQLTTAIPDLAMVCFDREIRDAVARARLSLWAPRG